MIGSIICLTVGYGLWSFSKEQAKREKREKARAEIKRERVEPSPMMSKENFRFN